MCTTLQLHWLEQIQGTCCCFLDLENHSLSKLHQKCSRLPSTDRCRCIVHHPRTIHCSTARTNQKHTYCNHGQRNDGHKRTHRLLRRTSPYPSSSSSRCMSMRARAILPSTHRTSEQRSVHRTHTRRSHHRTFHGPSSSHSHCMSMRARTILPSSGTRTDERQWMTQFQVQFFGWSD